MSFNIPKDHPRYESLMAREKIAEGMDRKVVARAGLFAHGRGEAFDYLLGESTQSFSKKAVRASAIAFFLAQHPVLSVNGNIAALCPEPLVEFAKLSGTKLEINLFYRSPDREKAILKVLKDAGAEEVLGFGNNASATIPELGSERRRVDPQGILIADLVFVPLEDGDRTEALVAMGKKVITVDLNPLSRTAQKSSISIVDNIVRVMPLLIEEYKNLQDEDPASLEKELVDFNNQRILKDSLAFIRDRLGELSV